MFSIPSTFDVKIQILRVQRIEVIEFIIRTISSLVFCYTSLVVHMTSPSNINSSSAKVPTQGFTSVGSWLRSKDTGNSSTPSSCNQAISMVPWSSILVMFSFCNTFISPPSTLFPRSISYEAVELTSSTRLHRHSVPLATTGVQITEAFFFDYQLQSPRSRGTFALDCFYSSCRVSHPKPPRSFACRADKVAG